MGFSTLYDASSQRKKNQVKLTYNYKAKKTAINLDR